MMTMSKPQSYSIDSLFRGLKGLLHSLPTDAEKRELLRDLKEAQDFLEELRLLVDAIPTMESSQELSVGLSRLYALTERAHRDNGLQRLLGLRGPAVGRKKTVVSADIEGRVSQLAAAIAESEIPELTELIAQEPLAVLKALAGDIGIRTRSKERKTDLASRIITHVENQRGYALLRGNGAETDAHAHNIK